MTKEIKLIKLYCTVCHYYDSTIVTKAQRLSNNFCPQFTDEECITTYIWGIAEQKYELKAIHEFIHDYYGEWFPDMPKYESYVKRIGKLSESFEMLAEILIGEQEINCDDMRYILDSMPIIVANERRSSSAKTASNL